MDKYRVRIVQQGWVNKFHGWRTGANSAVEIICSSQNIFLVYNSRCLLGFNNKQKKCRLSFWNSMFNISLFGLWLETNYYMLWLYLIFKAIIQNSSFHIRSTYRWWNGVHICGVCVRWGIKLWAFIALKFHHPRQFKNWKEVVYVTSLPGMSPRRTKWLVKIWDHETAQIQQWAGRPVIRSYLVP